MRISLSGNRASGFRQWSDAHPAKPDPAKADPTNANGGGYWGGADPVMASAERPHLPWLVPGAGRL